MPENKFYLSIGRHERYGINTPIEREDMLCAYLSGLRLKICLPKCETVYHSPLARAASTARFEALGLQCSHILEIPELEENATTFETRKFLNNLLQNTDNSVCYYHFVTHLPVIEKLGLPFLGAGDICLLSANNREEMLAENYTIQIISKPQVTPELYQKIGLSTSDLAKLSEIEIYQKLQNIGQLSA